MNERIYKGKVKELVHINTNTFGIRTYRIGFGKDKKALFQISSKRVMPIDENDTVLFTGKFISEKVFLIDDIKCVSGYTKQQKEEMMSEEQWRRMMIRQ